MIVVPRTGGCRVPGCTRPLHTKRFCAGHEARARKGAQIDAAPLGNPTSRDFVAMIVRMFVALPLADQARVVDVLRDHHRIDQLRAQAAD
jgi:hypothetical protein